MPWSFLGQMGFLEIRPLQETYQLQQTNKKFGVFFHLDTPKTAFLMRNLPIDPRNLGISRNKQDYSFQFAKKSRGGLPLLPGSLRLVTYVFPNNAHDVSRIYGSYLVS